MTKGKIEYAKIYRIVPKDNQENEKDIYIGSTCSKCLSERMAKHRYAYRKTQIFKSSFILFEKYGAENLKIELVQAVNCVNKEDLRKAEQEIINNTPNINIGRAYRSTEEKKARRRELYKLKKERQAIILNV